jgi:Subtilisin-like serine proteases
MTMGVQVNREGEQNSKRILVQFREGTSAIDILRLHRAAGGTRRGTIRRLGVHKVDVPPDRLEKALEVYNNDRRVECVKMDGRATVMAIGEPSGEPGDTFYRLQWGLQRIQAPQAWQITKGSPAVKIAVLDTGVDRDHADLCSKIVINRNYAMSWWPGNFDTPEDYYGHGTHCAAIAAALESLSGIIGVAPLCSIMNIKVLDNEGSGYWSDVASGIIWATDNGAKVISMSLGGGSGSSDLESAVNYAWNHGVVVVAAAGNNNTDSPTYPAYYQNCIAVAATDEADNKAGFSNYGSWVDVAAPGVNIFSAICNHSYLHSWRNGSPKHYASWGGTSMATPFVAGLAALLWCTEYGVSNVAVRQRIEETAEAAGDVYRIYGIKRINALRAVS